jgi:hypothetical protein
MRMLPVLQQQVQELFSTLAQAGLDVTIPPVGFVAVCSNARICEPRHK